MMLAAIARSRIAPSFFKSVGLNETNTRSIGKSNPLFLTAALIRSRSSFTAPSESPTISTAGIPRLVSVSTVTSEPS